MSAHGAVAEASVIVKLAEGARDIGCDTGDYLVQGHAESQEFRHHGREVEDLFGAADAIEVGRDDIGREAVSEPL